MEKNKTKIERGENFEFEEESFNEQTGEEEEEEEEEDDGSRTISETSEGNEEDQRKKGKGKERERVEEFSREGTEEEAMSEACLLVYAFLGIITKAIIKIGNSKKRFFKDNIRIEELEGMLDAIEMKRY
ncbi:hypothetical protein Glove_78g153 [Diversispora epigaea]|uniref:Uncharacterized protein n=1 Tax=Diversispora epigaea TaxID=1348612 RepID=A0A397JFD6_9GLOM|nr:hypothetical protein Glove_78g153 [Diversispora epigaea]